MLFRRTAATVVCLLLALTMTACMYTTHKPLYVSEPIDTDSLAKISSNTTSVESSHATITVKDINEEAKKLSSSPGRVALALIICKLDPQNALDNLAAMNAQELLNVLSETAIHKSLTLEAIDMQFYLKDILASEGINVTFNSNSVISSPSSQAASSGGAPDPNNSWIIPFQEAINQSED